MMFNRIRIQLTIRNAAVLSFILITLNLSIFLVTRQMLLDQIDRSLTDMQDQNVMTATAQSQVTSTTAAQNAIVFQAGRMDRPIIQLYWTGNDQPIPLPFNGQFDAQQLKLLTPSKLGKKLQSVKIGDQTFRVLNLDKPSVAKMASVSTFGGTSSSYIVAKQQMLSNISAEVAILRRLAYIMLCGGVVGLVIAVAAGYYLANRALIPIRLSMDKQEQFVADASHELRTPLSVIQAHTELLLRHPNHTIEQDSKHISTVLQESRQMSKLVSDLLTLARSDSNQLELDIKPIQFDRNVQDCVSKMQMLAEIKDIILQTEIDSSIPMNADEERLHQLLVIVLDNAIKYTPEGGLVRVICRKLAHSVQLVVEDTGIGIAPDNLPHVFDRFYRGDKTRSRQEGGTGLGLAIAKWIVEHHGGKIRVESIRSTGTQVFISLPR